MLVILKLEIPDGLPWLKVLNVSQRNCTDARSRIGMFLNSEIFQLAYPGPRTVPRPAFPGRTMPCATGEKQFVSNHLPLKPRSCGAVALGSHIMSGRELAKLDPRNPRPAGSTFEVVTVKGKPVAKLEIPENCQPLATY